MNTPPLSNPLSPKLEKLNRDIYAGLSEVRRHIKELEEVEKNQQTMGPSTFSEVLKQSIKSEKS